MASSGAGQACDVEREERGHAANPLGTQRKAVEDSTQVEGG